MTVEELNELNLPIEGNDTNCLLVGAAIDWLNSNTTLTVSKDDLENSVEELPDGAKLFLVRYAGLMDLDNGVTSESIGGMSQSFSTDSKARLLYSLASELIGDYLLGQVKSIPNVSRWK